MRGTPGRKHRASVSAVARFSTFVFLFGSASEADEVTAVEPARRPTLRERMEARHAARTAAAQAEQPSHVRVIPAAGTPQPEREPEEQAPEPPVVPEPEPTPEPVAQAEPEPVARPEPEPEPVAAEPAALPPPPPELREVPPPPVEPPPPPQQPDGVVAFVPRANGPRSWNLWDLERIAREREGSDPVRNEERAVLLMQLRQFASADGMLPPGFDGLIHEAFGEFVGQARP